MRPVEAPPAAAGEPRVEPLSRPAAAAVAGLTAAAVFAAGVYVAETRRPTPAPSAPDPAAAPPATPSGTATTSAAPPADARAAVTAAPSTAATPATPATPAGPRPGRGALRVHHARAATVFVNGVAAGRTEDALDVPCGMRFVRLGEPTPSGTRWIVAGKTVDVACGATLDVTF